MMVSFIDYCCLCRGADEKQIQSPAQYGIPAVRFWPRPRVGEGREWRWEVKRVTLMKMTEV